MLSFVWDEEKNKINVLKHGVSFQIGRASCRERV